MYTEELPKPCYTTTLVSVQYDCCGVDRQMKWVDANKNFTKNNGKHICRTCFLKTNNPANRPEVREKMKATCFEKYGTDCVLNTKENTQKRVEKMFGTKESTQKIVAKRKSTSIEKYGADHIMKTEEGVQRCKAALQNKYGVDYPLQSPEILSKMQTTILERYGVDNVAQLDSVQEKMASTNFERYGVEHYNQLPEMKDYLRANCREWLKESWENPWAKGITRPKEWNEKQRKTIRKLITEGNWPGGFQSNTKGRFPAWKCVKSMPRFLSSLELIFHFFLNTNDLVQEYDYEGLVIEYNKQDGTTHDYYVDFQVKYKNDTIIHNFEIKSYKNKDNIDVKLKYEAALEYCDNHNMTYTILFDEDIHKLGFDLEKIKQLPGIKF